MKWNAVGIHWNPSVGRAATAQPVFNGGAALSNMLPIDSRMTEFEWYLCAMHLALEILHEAEASYLSPQQPNLFYRSLGVFQISVSPTARQIIAYLARCIEYNRVLLDILIGNL